MSMKSKPWKDKRKTHGRTGTRVYSTWANMLQRCTNPNDPKYFRYGQKGISVCERWMSFENFFEDMGEQPEGMQIERKDNNGNYSPENCKWASRKEQCGNRKSTVFLTFRGETKNLRDWSFTMGKGGSYLASIGYPKFRGRKEKRIQHLLKILERHFE